MSSGGSPRAGALRPRDPRELGVYRIVGRLGEGGMGSVFLADSPAGQPVAVKVIKAELADDAEFRRRFRGEVARARQVPPFCTAEVLDADTEHDPPYLVAEYVDGPSLASVVQERGPLTAANQHGLAVGVAVALTAIHGAGVIHRDLKPSNVLLAPGSPKVIDFGIARGMSGTDVETRTDQVVGTVAYMAPERFGPGGSQTVTPAADIFAWGAVVTYAGTGRTPFGADIPAAMAVRIMTQPPDLEGLGGPLRDLVGWALAKEPADRPTARELLDHLLGGGVTIPSRPASFAQQPEVLAAAGITPTQVEPPGPPTEPPVPAAGAVPAPPESGRSRRGSRIAISALAISVLLLAGAVAVMMTGGLPLGRNTPVGQASNAAGPPSSQAAGPSTSPAPVTSAPPVSPTAPIAPNATLLVGDSLAAVGRWQASELSRFEATCVLDGRLMVTLGKAEAGSYRCRGVADPLTDFSVAVDATLINASSCAGIWFRFHDVAGGYALRICPYGYQLMTHVGKDVSLLKSMYFDIPIPLNEPTRVAIRMDGSRMFFFRDGEMVGGHTDPNASFSQGKVSLGVLPLDSEVDPPFRVAFADVEIYRSSIAG